jgi:hypothetical protein
VAELCFREPGGRAFFLGLPILVIVIGSVVAIAAHTLVIILAAIAAMTVAVWKGVTVPYEARIHAGGDVAFIAVRGIRHVNAGDIRRIAVQSSGAGHPISFYWDDGKASMQYKSGRALADYLRKVNPDIAFDR